MTSDKESYQWPSKAQRLQEQEKPQLPGTLTLHVRECRWRSPTMVGFQGTQDSVMTERDTSEFQPSPLQLVKTT